MEMFLGKTKLKCKQCNSHVLEVHDTLGTYFVCSSIWCGTIHKPEKNMAQSNRCNDCGRTEISSYRDINWVCPECIQLRVEEKENNQKKKTMQVQEGKYYKRDNASYTEDGRYSLHVLGHHLDLIEEVSDPTLPIKEQPLPLHPHEEKLTRLLNALNGIRGHHQQLIAQVGLQWVDTLLRKNADYGSSVFKEPVLAPGMPTTSAIDVRMSDKIARIQNLKTAKAEVAESIQDTYNDLGAYCLLRQVAVLLEQPAPSPEKVPDLSQMGVQRVKDIPT